MSNFESNASAIPAARPRVTVKTVTSLAMLVALTYLAMVFSKVLPQFNGFLQFEIKGTVVAIGGFLFGPLSAAVISIVVAFIEMFTVSDTGIIGCVMNLLAACAFACPAAYVYGKKRRLSGALGGLLGGWGCQVAVMMLWNYLVAPVYMGYSREAVAQLLLPAFLPFNVIKGGG